MSDQVPSVGRIVHFVATNGKHCAAIITDVSAADVVTLFIMDPILNLAGFMYGVLLDPDATTTLSWHWPERE